MSTAAFSRSCLGPAPIIVLVGALLLSACGGGGSTAASASSTPASRPATELGTGAEPPVTDPAGPGTGSATAATSASATTRPATSGLTRASTRPTATSGPPRTTASTDATSTALTALTITTRPAGGWAVEGTVSASPSCPVERPDNPCPPLPVAAHIEAYDDADRLVRSTDADAAGRFSLVLAPGRYVLTASTGAVFPSCRPFPVTMPENGAVRADITCDTGIR